MVVASFSCFFDLRSKKKVIRGAEMRKMLVQFEMAQRCCCLSSGTFLLVAIDSIDNAFGDRFLRTMTGRSKRRKCYGGAVGDIILGSFTSVSIIIV